MTVSHSHRWVLYGVVLVAVLFLVTACGGGGQQTQQPASQPSPPTEQPAQPPAQPEQTEETQLVERGQQLSSSIGCTACHSIDGTKIVGPTWLGLYGHEVEVILPDGTETKVFADDEYLRESIVDPNAKIAKGFQPNIMPIYQEQLSEEDIKAIIEYIKSLK